MKGKGKLYFTTADLAQLTGINTRKILRWMQESGVAVRRPGAHHQWMMPFERVREKWPEMWDRYCIEEGMWDALEACEHADAYVLPDHLRWCYVCGAIRLSGLWSVPTRRPTS